MSKENSDYPEFYVPAVVPLRVDPRKPVIRLEIPGELLRILPHRLPEYRALGFTDATLSKDRSSIILERNASPDEIGAIIEEARRNIEARMGSDITAADRPENTEAWKFHVTDTETRTSRSFFAGSFGNLCDQVRKR